MTRQTIHLYTVCWDEADMLGFFFRHYDPWVDRYVIFDDGSSDGSLDILGAHPKVDLRHFDHADPASFCISLQMLQDEVWKESRAEADWIIVTAIDEHLHVRHRDLAAYLAEQTACGVTLVPALGFDMNHPELPPNQGRLVDVVTRGRPRKAFNKLSIFNPQAVKETNFGAGRHAANPAGDIRLPSRDALMLWHYKHLGFERYNEREIAQAARLGQADKSRGLGRHYSWPIDERRAFWLEMKHESRDLSVDGFVPDEVCVRPLWWEERGLARVATAIASPSVRTERAPLVSVLVKSHNHAPFVRRCIESVLEQGFGDFEIVVTDDASTDDTAEIVESISDPRVRLEVLPHNVGISGAMNLTIARARGRYLAILNSDDYALPDRLSRQVDFLDTHPDVALMFGQICAVDDTGASTDPFNDFSMPLRLPDFSRRSWLRQFFFSGNCLCAPTAMIRREAYKWVGLYDARLFNLQDFDMWVRMVMAGFNIHVSTEVLSAFRVRNNMANASAPTMENNLRSWFEYLQILDRFAMLPDATILEVFSDPTGGASGNGQQVLGRLAIEIDFPPHQLFGLQMLFQSAETAADRAELRRRMGTHDVFGAGRRDRFASMLHGFEDEYAGLENWLVQSLHRMRARPREASSTVPDWFNEDAYLRSNPDVAHAHRLGVFSSGYSHWLSHGYKEGRPFRTR